jgi:phosphomannomutase
VKYGATEGRRGPGARHDLKIGVSGVRGVVGDTFTPQLAAAFAQAFGTLVGHGSVVVGRDTRASGVMIEHAVVAGLQSVGCRPVLADIVPTPTLLMLTQELGARGGIAITASHNPAAWNALKFVTPRGLFLGEIQADELFDLYHQQDFALVPETEIPAVRVLEDPLRGHYQRILDYVDAAAIRARGFKVAVDCCNGVGALYSVPFLEDLLGCQVVSLFDAPTGEYERDPEPLPQHLTALSAAVREAGCQAGFAQDPDGDRLALVDEQGQARIEDLTVALAVQQVLSAHERGPVAINLSTSRCVEQVARRLGSEVVRTRTGEINVSETMLSIGAVVGGENNGGVIIPRIHPCRDSFAGMAVILELMAATGKSLSALCDEVPRYHLVKDKLPIRAGQASAVYRHLRRQFRDYPVSLQDGVFVDLGGSWLHVRRSNTEPVIRMTIEAADAAEGEALRERLRSEIGAALAAAGG